MEGVDAPHRQRVRHVDRARAVERETARTAQTGIGAGAFNQAAFRRT
jgi:hypothetical protein